ncbi:High mobility group B protein 1 [Forsythia ovata]|uniref:High mobility group B protein 1 n=1 Tax=Forsythia ovata TaxID=205694 RepID=A0ABD1TB93_9LAMI
MPISSYIEDVCRFRFFLSRLRDHRSLVIFKVLESMKTSSRGKATVRKETKEALKPVDDRKLGKRKAAIKADKRQTKKGKAAKKDPNKPKRPPSAFFVFLEEFRKTFKKENPNVKAVSAEKAPYEAKAAKKKTEYENLMNAYNKKQESSADEGGEESEKSRSEVHDDDDESGQSQCEEKILAQCTYIITVHQVGQN